MKKIVAFLLAVCLCVGLCACASMDSFKDNLGDNYKKTILDEDDLEGYAELLGLDADDYKIKSALEATHKKKGTGVVIIECGSAELAEELADDAEDMVEYLTKSYGSAYTFGHAIKGRFVLFGEENAIDDALGE